MSNIRRLHAREVLDSRGRPTIEVELTTDDGACVRAQVPSGASTGRAEALELRDRQSSHYSGWGVRAAVENVSHEIAPALLGMEVADQAAIDARLIALDATPQKSRLGANAILGVSLAVARAAAVVARVPLWKHLHSALARAESLRPAPVEASTMPPGVSRGSSATHAPRIPMPMTNMISGGLHAGGNLDFQDFLIIPRGAPDYARGLEWIVRCYWRLGARLNETGFEGRLVGDEGGYGPRLNDARQALEFVASAVEAEGLAVGSEVTMAIDVASSHFFDGTRYHLRNDGRTELLTADELIARHEALVDSFAIETLEDPLAEDDWDAWTRATAQLGARVALVGDDLLATNPRRIERAIAEQAANAVLVKMNQIGTLSETFEAIHLARAAGWRVIVSARSGETEDSALADLAVASAADYIKIGSVARSERLAKYNRLLQICDELAEFGE